MKLKTMVLLTIIILLLVGFSGCLGFGQLKSIEKSTNIPYHGVILHAEGVGSAGTLYCTGTIVETETGLESITITWLAKVTFPSNFISGALSNSMIQSPFDWARALQTRSSPGISNVFFRNMNGEYHELKMVETFYEDRVLLKWYTDDILVDEYDAIGGGFSKFTIDGSYHSYNVDYIYYRIYAAFLSMPDLTTQYQIEIETQPFYLVKDRNICNFYFSDELPSSPVDDDDSSG